MPEQDKPPIGLRPAKLADIDRCVEILEAMLRYLLGGDIPPEEWHNEFNQRMHDIRTREERLNKPAAPTVNTRRR